MPNVARTRTGRRAFPVDDADDVEDHSPDESAADDAGHSDDVGEVDEVDAVDEVIDTDSDDIDDMPAEVAERSSTRPTEPPW
ncbi:MAG: hypothetical protein IPK13_03650 [Deltaproteobacteria bacterium]|nr:hypothetical protein [Deltaproteobacteria bacterium]